MSIWEIEFIRTSCRLLDINSEDVMKRIVRKALAKRVMASIRAQLDEVGHKAENHKRPTPTRLSPH